LKEDRSRATSSPGANSAVVHTCRRPSSTAICFTRARIRAC
jgi:hypothetical protein